MKLTIPALNDLMQKLEAQPSVASSTPGPACRECGLPWLVVHGSNTRKWRILHAGCPAGRACDRYRDVHPQFSEQAEAITHATQLSQ